MKMDASLNPGPVDAAGIQEIRMYLARHGDVEDIARNTINQLLDALIKAQAACAELEIGFEDNGQRAVRMAGRADKAEAALARVAAVPVESSEKADLTYALGYWVAMRRVRAAIEGAALEVQP